MYDFKTRHDRQSAAFKATQMFVFMPFLKFLFSLHNVQIPAKYTVYCSVSVRFNKIQANLVQINFTVFQV